MPEQVSGLEPLINDFDLFLIDQFGVLHNGVEPYSDAVETLEMLKSRSKRVVIVSNSGKRSSINIARLAKLGFGRHLFDHFITSGEVAYQRIESLLQGSSIKTCFLIARDNDVSAVAGLNVQLVYDAADADLILISASEAERYSEDTYRDQLRIAAQTHTACICTNPDKKMLTNNGLQFGAGRIAEIYQELGGEVEWVGKPYPAIYQHIINLHRDCNADRTLCIGDSVEHDITGGKNIGMKTMLVMTGINDGLSVDEMQSQFRHYQVTPDFMAYEFCFKPCI